MENAHNRGRRYSKPEIVALRDIEQKNGPIRYINPYDLELEFYERTGVYRESGPLYMANWRRLKGMYDGLLAS